MVYDPEIHHRRSIRLRGYDYSLANAYYVTICTQDKLHLFGKVIDGKMVLNDAGRMIEKLWTEIPQYYPSFNVDVFQVMPNHFHGIVVIVGAGPRACPENAKPVSVKQSHIRGVQPWNENGQKEEECFACNETGNHGGLPLRNKTGSHGGLPLRKKTGGHGRK